MHRVTLTLVPMALIVLTSVVGAYAAQEQEVEEARRRYPPEMTSSLLRGKIPSPGI